MQEIGEAEATATVAALERCGLNDALDKIIRELQQVSTFTFEGDPEFKSAEDLVPWLQDLRLGKVALDRPELFYCLHLITQSRTRHEELNGCLLTPESLRDLLEAKLRMFAYKGKWEFGSLLEMARAVDGAREALPPQLFIYQAIDGAAERRHRELTTEWTKPEGFDAYAADVRARVSTVRGTDDAMQLLDGLSAQLRQISGTDYTLVCGPRRLLEPGQDVTPEDFFAYVFTEPPETFLGNTAFADVAQFAEFLLPAFRGALRRYHLEGYQVLLPGICVNEAIRPCHEKTGHKGSMRCAHPVLGRKHQVVDVRCIDTGGLFEGITATNLSYQLWFAALYAEIIGRCLEEGIGLPGVYSRAAAPST